MSVRQCMPSPLKLAAIVGGLAVLWQGVNYLFPFGISKSAQRAAFSDVFRNSKITHIRILYACCGNEAPIESSEAEFESFSPEDQAEIYGIFRRMELRTEPFSPYMLRSASPPEIELRLSSNAYGSMWISLKHAVNSLQVQRPFSVPKFFNVRCYSYEFQTAICKAMNRSRTPLTPHMSHSEFESQKEGLLECWPRIGVENHFLIRLPPGDEALTVEGTTQ